MRTVRASALVSGVCGWKSPLFPLKMLTLQVEVIKGASVGLKSSRSLKLHSSVFVS